MDPMPPVAANTKGKKKALYLTHHMLITSLTGNTWTIENENL